MSQDWTKTRCKEDLGVEDGPLLHFVAAVGSSVGATLFGMPCDYLFTQYTSAAQRGVKYNGLWHCARTLLAEGGPQAYYRGSSAFFVRVVPIFTLYFPIYEQVRKLMGMGYLD